MMLTGRLMIAAAAAAGAAAACWALISRRSSPSPVDQISDYRDTDDVDAMAEDSFPASDPPSFTPTTGETKASASG